MKIDGRVVCVEIYVLRSDCSRERDGSDLIYALHPLLEAPSVGSDSTRMSSEEAQDRRHEFFLTVYRPADVALTPPRPEAKTAQVNLLLYKTCPGYRVELAGQLSTSTKLWWRGGVGELCR
nr:hypothetical protein CFP56_50870 [Quercus suber]